MERRGRSRAATGPAPQGGRIHQKRGTVNAVSLFCFFPGSVILFHRGRKAFQLLKSSLIRCIIDIYVDSWRGYVSKKEYYS